MIKLPEGFRYVDEYRTDITSPAYTNPSRGEVHINRPVFDKLTRDHQNFIVLHELAHRYTEDEFMADQIAFTNLMKLKNSPKIASSALFSALSGIIPEHRERYLRMLATAAEYDLRVNGNRNALKVLERITNLIPKTMNYKIDQQTEDQIIDALVAQGYDEDAVLDAIVDIEDSESFEGTYFASGDRAAKKEARQQKKAEKKAAKEAKKAEKQAAKDAKKAAKEEKKERRQEAKVRKQELKNEAKEARINRKNIKAEATANKRNAKAEGIASGTYDPMGGLGSALGGVASKYLGVGGDDEGGEVVEEKSNLPLILGIGGGVLAIVIIVVIILVTRKK